MKGQVFKIHSDFYYAHTELGILECKLKETIKKRKESVLVGDFVELEQVNEISKQAFIKTILKRTNYISKPKAANITQALIVSALKEPELNFEQLNRYIALCEYHNIKPVLCFNKNDLEKDKASIEHIKKIYESLNYELVFTSALKKTGLKPLLKTLKNNTSIFCGSSGVGKSSIINMIGEFQIRTQEVSLKSKKGIHTTRHCEIIEIEEDTYVVDTPGFSNIKFNFLAPMEIQKLFKEINLYADGCKFSNCLHLQESGCNVKSNLENIDDSRYESYTKFIEEAKEYKEKIIYSGTKTESAVKEHKNKTIVKISSKKRTGSRRTSNQNIKKQITEQDDE